MYVVGYTKHMATTITQFRKELFHLADQALKGESVEFLYKGIVFKVVPEKKQSKLDNLVGQPVVAPGADLASAGKELQAEMESEWMSDWSRLE
jgi:hypothetical protein